MENASKALITAAEILIGVMIISLGVYLFNVFGKYSKETNKKIDDAQIAQFNSQFVKYYGDRIDNAGNPEPIKCTIHEITSLANLAKKSNEKYEIDGEAGYSAHTFYIQIDIKSKTPSVRTYKNIEKKDNNSLVTLIKENDILYSRDTTGNIVAQTKYYRCTKCEINTETKLVNYMLFEEI